MKRTKIVATIGPASEKVSTIKAMMRAGMNMSRLNFSHNIHSHHRMLIKNIRTSAKELDKNVAILQDLQGPRIRIGDLAGEEIGLKKGQEVIFFYSTGKYQKARPITIPVHYKGLAQDLKKDDIVLISDGIIKLRVKKISGEKIYCDTMVGGVIKTHKGMNFPDSKIKADPLTAKDIKDLSFGIRNKVDYVALSFVKSAREINNLRKRIVSLEKKYYAKSDLKKLVKDKTLTKIIAKIERREAVKNFDSILKAVDGIMVARGDLGIELPFEDVPLIQKEIIKKCNYAGKPVIVATQMLESMITNPVPTRAEASDVANAILDGTDAVMLSGESATGKYPVQAIKAMNRIAKEVEPTEFELQQDLEARLKRTRSKVDFSAYNAQDVAEKLRVKAIVCLTDSGHTAKMISRYKSKVPLVALTPNKKTKNQLALVWGVDCHEFKMTRPYKKLATKVTRFMIKKYKLKKGQSYILCAGQSFGIFRRGNLVKIETA